ncbi:hypothetical protein [Nitrosopumilus sp.]|uniref:hypothetical protein n=1 Tax=Nitrosopumilus sp. TaxID=2024843 RepID=UPI00247B9669|nr:hypothetical protein [Nitrosopumilus sp.]MCV0431819.1 hypothetical protein [Nitrosopumilus sp.]
MKSTIEEILNNYSQMVSLIEYKELTTTNKSYDKSMHCDYCGCGLKSQEEYCSETCKQKDSVWHSREDEE